MRNRVILFLIIILSIGPSLYSRAIVFPVERPADLAAAEVVTISSKSLGEERQARIYLPATYTTTKQRFAVIYTLDGEMTGSITANAVDFMTSYSSMPQIPEAVVVAIVNTNRNRDMPIPEGYQKAGEDKFLAFITDELVPVIEQKYRTEPLRVLLGHSQGGLFASYAMTARPDKFPWIVAIDAPLAGFAPVRSILEKTKALAGRSPSFRGRLITVETLYGWRKEWASMPTNQQGGFYGAQIEIKDETHESMAYKGVYEGLKRIFFDYPPDSVRSSKANMLPDLERRFSALSEMYGYKVSIPKEALLSSADQNISIQHGAEAVALIKHAVAIYGGSQRTERQLGEAETAAKKGRDARIEEWAALSLPSIESMKPFLGTWERKGDATWVIAFENNNGIVRPVNTVIPPSFEPFHLDVQFVRVLGGGQIQWGERNGKGPGVTVFTARLIDANTLEGTAERVGFLMPPPPFKFTYTRRKSEQKNE